MQHAYNGARFLSHTLRRQAPIHISARFSAQRSVSRRHVRGVRAFSSSHRRYAPDDRLVQNRWSSSPEATTTDSLGNGSQDGDAAATSRRPLVRKLESPDDPHAYLTPEGQILRTQRHGLPRPKTQPHHFEKRKPHRREDESQKPENVWKEQTQLVKALDFSPDQVKELPMRLLEDALQALSGVGALAETQALVHKMLSHRGVPPNAQMYRALILSNTAPEGSVDRVMHLLKEMEAEKVALDQGMCDAVLRVLAVHPDHILRIEILQHMERRWYGLSEQAHQLFVAGLFRSLQFEHALQELQTMKLNSLRMDSWLFTLAISTLVEAEEFDEAMKVMRLRIEHIGNNDTTALWTYLLDSAAAAHHYITCRYIWVRCVLAEYITVSSGTCTHLLTMAARKGDVDFALDIIRLVKRYHFGLEYAHWEMLVETYATAGQLENALNAMVDMYASKFKPDHFTTRPIYTALQTLPAEQRDDTCLELYDYLLNRQGHLGRFVPAAAVNVLIESCTVPQSAYDMYHNIRLVCKDGPDAATFHHLLAFTTQEGDAERALRYAEEHKVLGYTPGLVVYDGLLMSLIRGEHDIDTIMDMYDEMRSVHTRPVFRTVTALYIALRVLSDPRAPEVFSHLHRRDADTLPIGELPLRLQKLRIEAAAEVARAKGRRVDRPVGEALVFPPGQDSSLQTYIEEVQVEAGDVGALAVAKLHI